MEAYGEPFTHTAKVHVIRHVISFFLLLSGVLLFLSDKKVLNLRFGALQSVPADTPMLIDAYWNLCFSVALVVHILFIPVPEVIYVENERRRTKKNLKR